MTDNQDELVGRLARYIYGTQHNSRYQIEKVKKAMRLIRPGDTYNGHMWVPVEPTKEMYAADYDALDIMPFEERWTAILKAVKGDE